MSAGALAGALAGAWAVATAPAMVADLYFNLGNAQERRGFPALAADAYRSCLGVAPDRADASNNLALSLARRGSYGEAVEVARAALAHEWANSPPHH